MILTRRRLFGLLPAGLLGSTALLPMATPPSALDKLKQGDPFTVTTWVFLSDKHAHVPFTEPRWALQDTADALTNRGMRVTAAFWYKWVRSVKHPEAAHDGPGWYNTLQATGKLDATATQAENRALIQQYAPAKTMTEALLFHQRQRALYPQWGDTF